MISRSSSRIPLLDIRQLTISFPDNDGTRLHAVRDLGLQVDSGEIVGIAGESGSGKSISSLALLGLLPSSAQVTGQAIFDGTDLLAASPRVLAGIRGNDLAMVFQDPMTSLHPMLTIGRQLTEHLQVHTSLGRTARRRRAMELLELVRIPDPSAALARHAHQFSGGMRQRIAIASALCCEPKLLIADEPTTALDVTVQAGILSLLNQLRHDLGLAVIMITHDLGVMSAIADRVAVMYSGRIVEAGQRSVVLTRPRHPYTRGLMDSLPNPDDFTRKMKPVAGSPPLLSEKGAGCAFAPRCQWAEARCALHVPLLRERSPQQAAACLVDPLEI